MHRYLPVCAVAGALALCVVALVTPAQAMPAAGLSVPGSSAHAATIVDRLLGQQRFFDCRLAGNHLPESDHLRRVMEFLHARDLSAAVGD